MASNAVKISPDEIEFHPYSYGDPNGQLFYYKDGLYRGITAKNANFYRQLFKDGIIQRLIAKGLFVETELTDLRLDGYEFVVKQRLLPFVSYPYEWCAEMLKDAALLMIDLTAELNRQKLLIQDVHSWNIIFDGCRPVYVDFGSIIPADKEMSFYYMYDEFLRFFIYPLKIMAEGHESIARCLLHNYDDGVLESDVAALVFGKSLEYKTKKLLTTSLYAAKRCVPYFLRSKLKKNMMPALRSEFMSHVYRRQTDFMNKARREIESITIPFKPTVWSQYYKEEGWHPPLTPSEQWNQKHRSFYKVLSDLKPYSFLDIGCSTGWYSRLAALLGCEVVAFDTDEAAVRELYRKAKEDKLSIQPLVMSFANPSPGYGACNKSIAPAIERLKCDMVFAGALVHHIVFRKNLIFKQIAEEFSVFSKKWLLVEFVPREDENVQRWLSEKHSWYTLDNFISAIKQYFKSVKIYPSYPEPRILLLCEK